MTSASRFRFGPYELDLGRFKLLRDGEALAVEPKGIDLLRVLVERAPRVVDKVEIFSVVWKDIAVTDNALTRLVTHLRKALGDDPKTPRYIETIARRGYRFVAPVEHVEAADSTAAPSPAQHSPHAPAAILGIWRRTPLAYTTAGALVLLSTVALVGSRMVLSPTNGESWLTDGGVPDVARLAALRPEQVTAGRSYDGYLAFSQDGGSVAFSSDRLGSLEIFVQGMARGSASVAVTDRGRHSVQPAWSPDGQFIAYHEVAGNGIWIVPARGGVARRLSDFGSNPSWSPDGRTIAFQSLPVTSLEGINVPGALSTIWTVATDGPSAPVQLTRSGTPQGPHLAPRWLPDSRHLLFAAAANFPDAGGTSLWNLDIVSRSVQRLVADKQLTPDYVVAAGGRSIYFVSRLADTIWWMPLGPGGTWQADPQPTGLAVGASQIAHLAISGDGRRLAWTGLESSMQIWETPPPGGSTPQDGATPLVQGLGVWYGLPAPASDGRIAITGGRPGAGQDVYLLAPHHALAPVTVGGTNNRGAQWMPGEREIAYITDVGKDRVFVSIDPDTGRTRTLFPLTEVPYPAASQPSTAAPTSNLRFNRDFTTLALSAIKDGRPNIWLAGIHHEHPDGTLRQVTFEGEAGSYPVWSADGRWLAYQCASGTDTNVCVIDREGGHRAQLTHEAGQSWVGGWKPDNDTILFAGERDGVWNIMTVSRSSGSTGQLTHFTEPQGYVRYPRWDEAGRRTLFEREQTTGRIWSVELPR